MNSSSTFGSQPENKEPLASAEPAELIFAQNTNSPVESKSLVPRQLRPESQSRQENVLQIQTKPFSSELIESQPNSIKKIVMQNHDKSEDQTIKQKKGRQNRQEETVYNQSQQMRKLKPPKITNRSSAEKLQVSIAPKTNEKAQKKIPDPKELQQKIKEIAAQIRRKVKRDGPGYKKIQAIERNLPKKANKNDITLTPLNHSAATYQFMLTSLGTSNHLSPRKNSNLIKETTEIAVQALVKSILKKDILEKVFRRIEQKQRHVGVKLKLDPIKHHYPMTSFRKAVLRQDKTQQLMDISRQRQKSQKLQRRKQIFNQSRYQRYAQVIRRSNKEMDGNKDSTVSQVLSVELVPDNPEVQISGDLEEGNNRNQMRAILQNTEILAEVNKKPEVAASIAELDSLIQKMGQSNQDYKSAEWEQYL